MRRKKTKKENLMEAEKVIFSALLITVGIFVMCLFIFTVIGLSNGTQDGYILKTQMIGGEYADGTRVVQMEHRSPAHTMIVMGSLVFGLMGGVIFLGLKINDRLN